MSVGIRLRDFGRMGVYCAIEVHPAAPFDPNVGNVASLITL